MALKVADLTAQERANFFAENIPLFSASRINPYCAQILIQACKNFNISIVGQRRLSKALNDLPYVEALDPNLSFGWGLEHLIRRSQLNLSFEYVLITGTLADCFHNSYCTEVLHALAKRTIPKSQNTPHIYQFLDLISFMSGILATDDFGLLVENYIALDPYSVMQGGKYSTDRCLVPPASIAEALIAIGELTSGQRLQLSIRGGAVVGWVAALAEAFLNLTVTIESKKGDHLHGPRENAQLILIYTDRPELVIEDATMPALTQEISNISLLPYSQQIHFVPFGGKVPWITMLPQIFGRCFHELDHKHLRVMCTAIGTAFRAMEAAKDDSSISAKRGPLLTNPPPETSASQLITTLTAYLSSLQHGQGRMERQLKLSPQEAAKIHMNSIHELCTICRCTFCSKAADKAPEASVGNGVNASDDQGVGYCLPAIVESIIMIGLLMARIVLVHPLNPSREGVQLLYKLRTDRFIKSTDHNVLSPTPSTVASLYDNVLTGSTAQISRMAVKFFGGGHLPPLGDHLLPHETVALIHEGMVAFAAELAGGKGVRRDMKGMVRIVNGGFGLRGKMYRIAAWSTQRPGGSETWQWEEIDLEHLRGLGGKLWFK